MNYQTIQQNKFFTSRWLVLLLVTLVGCASNDGLNSAGLNMAALEAADITNFRAPESQVLSSGQPTEAQLQVMANAGVKHVVNLRTAGEQVDFDEKAAVEAAGMTYYSIPVAGGAGVNSANASSLQQLLNNISGEPVLVHCASGNRVGGLMAVSAFQNGQSIDGAMAEGARWGMTSDQLQQTVRQTLSGN